MCNLSEGVMEKGMEKGITKGRAEERLASIRNLMETLGLTLGQAMEALKVPEADRVKYAELLGK